MKKKLLLVLLFFVGYASAQKKQDYKIIAYYTGDVASLKEYPLEKLTHIIYSFVKLRNDSLMLRDDAQEKTILELVALKKSKYHNLKLLVSMGGWSGCAPCSELFGSEKHRNTFAKTTVALLKKYQLDGLDLDWEYPAIEGFPGHQYKKEDQQNFTKLLKAIRLEMGKHYSLSFAAGGFVQYLEESIEWGKVYPLVDFINLMTYDLVGGYATTTGHHTPLYSYNQGQESTDKCVNWLLKHHAPADKLIIGAAFYARVWEKVSASNNGLYQSGVFKEGVDFSNFFNYFSDTSGFVYHWDEKAQAPYQYNAQKQLFATFDNEHSINAKAQYVQQKKLGGIMFWELIQDKKQNGLVDEMYKVLKTAK